MSSPLAAITYAGRGIGGEGQIKGQQAAENHGRAGFMQRRWGPSSNRRAVAIVRGGYAGRACWDVGSGWEVELAATTRIRPKLSPFDVSPLKIGRHRGMAGAGCCDEK